jgi:hypothetical protein
MKPAHSRSTSPLLTLCGLLALALGAAACPAEDLEPGPTPGERDAAALDGRRDQDILVADAALDGPPATRPPEADASSDGPSGSEDALVCPPGTVPGYQAGCGQAAQRTCINARPDAGACTYCGCDGTTTTGRCEGSLTPFLHAGACAPKGKPDPCGCKADEVCVQINDSSGLCRSKTPRLVCQKVTAACRAKLVPGQRHCRAMPECEGELCGAPLQCRINVPCGNETDAAAVHCYGP